MIGVFGVVGHANECRAGLVVRCAHHIQHHARLTQRYFDRAGKRIGTHGAQKSGGNTATARAGAGLVGTFAAGKFRQTHDPARFLQGRDVRHNDKSRLAEPATSIMAVLDRNTAGSRLCGGIVSALDPLHQE